MLLVTNLKTEYKTNPVGLKPCQPRLSWMISDDQANVVQAAYRILCASSKPDLRNEHDLIWDSGKIESDQSVHLTYNGAELRSGQRVYWKVKVWDDYGNESDWSEPVFFEMGLFDSTDWIAQWIVPGIPEDSSDSTPCPFLRKEFDTDKKISKATAYITAYGLYELHMNGRKVSEDLFTPGWTSYNHRLQYQVYDVTRDIQAGANAVGVVLGDGWYRGYLVWQGNKNLYGDKLALLCQIIVQYDDGSEEWIITDESWQSSTGPILKSDIYNGETYDARLEMENWDKAGFDASGWGSVLIKNYGFDKLVASEGVPVRITETLKPVTRFVTPKGELVLDMGQNMVGWVRFRLKGEKGRKITLNHAEVLDQEGNVYLDNIRDAKAEDVYIFKGTGIEEHEPRFTFHGFRYVRVSDYDGEISLDDIDGRVVHSDMAQTGTFECGDSLINRLQQNIDWGLRGNFLDVPTDCPQRDERLGWTGDAQVFAPTACFNRDTAAFYTKWMKDFIPDQKANGSVPWVVPNVIEDGAGTGWSDGFGATGWADAVVVIPWTVYRKFGDKRILEEQYASMKGWEEYMISESGEDLIFNAGFHFGDWLSFAEYYSLFYNAPDYGYAGAHTDKDLIATAYFYYTTGLMQKIAGLLRKVDDEQRYATLRPKIKTAFNTEFLTQTGRLTSNTQTAYALALAFGLIPDELKEHAAKRLVDDVNHFGHLTTGFLGTPLLCQALTDSGYPDIAYKLLFNKKYPSWLYPVTQGATTIWERWDGIKPDGSFQNVGMNSFNHYAYGAVGDWLYSYVAGITQDEETPGYKKIIIKPYPTKELGFAKAKLQSMYGVIRSEWKYESEKLLLEIEIPVNTTAEIHLPVSESEEIYSAGKPLNQNREFSVIGYDGNRTLVQVGSGVYKFEIRRK
ncbi:family 78 glycoside hydrolase catalytic domain [Saccharicrinis sp. FJH2]|uniref:family 78 glycoside hydrolase catalytic domain n=1 Tax=Saccharicrinis sp. FJH65 TaxID=3344659 RepID=UPI0035F3A43B